MNIIKYIVICCMALALFVASDAGAFTYLGSARGVGDPVTAVSSRVLGMGGSALAAAVGPEAIFYNPANIMWETSLSYTGTLDFTNLRETVEETGSPTRYTSGYFLNIGSLAAYYPFKSGWALAAGYRPLFNFDYGHSRKMFSAGIETRSRDHDNSGGIGLYNISAAANISRILKVGADWGMIRGGSLRESTSIVSDTSKTVSEIESSYSGSRYGLGAGIEIVKEICFVGARWTSAYMIKDKWGSADRVSSWTSGAWSSPAISSKKGRLEYSFPAEAGIGILYNFFQREQSSIAVDIVKTFWGNFEYEEKKDTSSAGYGTVQEPLYRNTVRLSVGVEHRVAMKLFLRYGFIHMPYYGNSSSDTTMLTAGVGFPSGINNFIDLAAAYGRRSFFGENVFFTDDEAVDERIFRLSGTLIRRF
jgi:hypothetical protein